MTILGNFATRHAFEDAIDVAAAPLPRPAEEAALALGVRS